MTQIRDKAEDNKEVLSVVSVQICDHTLSEIQDKQEQLSSLDTQVVNLQQTQVVSISQCFEDQSKWCSLISTLTTIEHIV
jgi:hypothetical protein